MRMRSTLLVGLLLLYAIPAFSQGCAMCYSSGAAVSKDGQRVINRAVLVLLVPPVTFMTLGVGLAYRYAKKRDLEELCTNTSKSSLAVGCTPLGPAQSKLDYGIASRRPSHAV